MPHIPLQWQHANWKSHSPIKPSVASYLRVKVNLYSKPFTFTDVHNLGNLWPLRLFPQQLSMWCLPDMWNTLLSEENVSQSWGDDEVTFCSTVGHAVTPPFTGSSPPMKIHMLQEMSHAISSMLTLLHVFQAVSNSFPHALLRRENSHKQPTFYYLVVLGK